MLTSAIKKIKKRSGEIVDFEPHKIKIAISRAFIQVRGVEHEEAVSTVVTNVLSFLEKVFVEKAPSVEEVQNVVEKILMEASHFDVARAYIIYRYEHAKIRQEKKEETLKKIDKAGLYVVKRSGKRELFSIDKLKKSLSYATKGFENVVDTQAILNQCRNELYEDISTKDIERALIMVVRSWIEHDPAYSYVAARLLHNRVYKTVVGAEAVDFSKLDKQLRQAFVRTIKKAAQIGKLDPRILLFDLEKLSNQLKFERDELFHYLGAQTLADRYFLQDPDTRDVMETPQMFWMRVAMGLAINEQNRDERAIEFYEVMSALRFVPSTPTLFHAGTMHPQLSSCYLTTVEDSLDHIFKCIGDNAQLSKWSGGIGNDWTNLRGTGARIKGTGVESQGAIPFLKIANDTTVAINRSGRRRGATCAYLESWHYDIEDFLELRKNTGDERRRTHDMDTSNWIPDLLMKRVKEDGDWHLFSPDETPELHHIYGRAFEKKYKEYEEKAARGEMHVFKKVKARDLWKKMITMLFETGHPWITFKDPCNVRSPQDHVGVVHSSNLCTEITLNTSADETAVCNLGSVNLAWHMTEGKLDEALIKDTVTTAMRMLDNVIDANFYPTKEAYVSNMRHRPVGLGIMGFQDALYVQNIAFDTEECVQFADTSMEMISYYAILASSDLARERGAYETFPGSKWDRGIFPIDTLELLEKERGLKIDVSRTTTMNWSLVRESVKKYGMRNSNCLAMAPTATISNIAGSTPTIEPIYKNIYVKSNVSGDFVVINPYLVTELKKLNLWDDEMLGKIKYSDGTIANIPEIPQSLKNVYKEVFEVNPKWLIKSAAYRGKWIDQSQSLNIFYAGKSGKDLNDIYFYAWEMGLKTTYYLRSLAMSQVEKSTVSTDKYGSTHTRKQSAGAGETVEVSVTAVTVETEPTPSAQLAGTPTSTATATATATQTQIKIKESAPTGEIKLCKINDPNCEACQ